MEYFYEFLLFLAQAATVVIAVVLVLSAAASFGTRRQHGETGHLDIRKRNARLDDLRDGMRHELLPQGEVKKLRKHEAKEHKAAQKAEQKSLKRGDGDDGSARRRVFVLEFDGDLQASRVKTLRTEVTAVLTMARPGDEVVVRIESPGGSVHGYGLAASQLDRFRAHGIPLTAAVDKVAASGGYLMAAVADRILAAPFAVIGSIGVVAQVPNVHRLLKKHDVDVEVITAGKYKRTLTVLGENTEEARQKFTEELEDVHALFQEYVAARRPALDMDAVATGEAWYGPRALEKQLVDELVTSDEYLNAACEAADVYELKWVEHKKPIERLMAQAEAAVERVLAGAAAVLHR